MAQRPRRVRPASPARAGTWPGVASLEAITVGPRWPGPSSPATGAVTGWHHHGQNDTSLSAVAAPAGE